MSRKSSLIVLCCMCALQVLCAQEMCRAGGVAQFFIKVDEQGVCGEKLEGKVLALDQYGAAVKGYQGPKKAQWIVKEDQGRQENSSSIGPDTLEFTDGQAAFFATDSESETLELTLAIDNNKSLFPARITFIGKEAAVKKMPPELPPGDSEPPYITEIVMNVQSIIEVNFNEEVDDTAATDPSNYDVACQGKSFRPRNVELHGRKAILQMGEPMPEHTAMYIELKNIKDKAGNTVTSGNRSPNYDVPCCGAGT